MALLCSTGFGWVCMSGSLVRCKPEAGGGQGAQDEADVAKRVLGHFNSPYRVCLLYLSVGYTRTWMSVQSPPEAGGGQGAQDETDVAKRVLGHFNSPFDV